MAVLVCGLRQTKCPIAGLHRHKLLEEDGELMIYQGKAREIERQVYAQQVPQSGLRQRRMPKVLYIPGM